MQHAALCSQWKCSLQNHTSSLLCLRVLYCEQNKRCPPNVTKCFHSWSSQKEPPLNCLQWCILKFFNSFNIWLFCQVMMCFSAACVPLGAGGVSPGGAGLEQDWVHWQSAVHQPHRGTTGPVWSVGWGMQGRSCFLSVSLSCLFLCLFF